MEFKAALREIDGILDDDNLNEKERRRTRRKKTQIIKKLKGRDAKFFASPESKGPIPKRDRDKFKTKQQINKMMEELCEEDY